MTQTGETTPADIPSSGAAEPISGAFQTQRMAGGNGPPKRRDVAWGEKNWLGLTSAATPARQKWKDSLAKETRLSSFQRLQGWRSAHGLGPVSTSAPCVPRRRAAAPSRTKHYHLIAFLTDRKISGSDRCRRSSPRSLRTSRPRPSLRTPNGMLVSPATHLPACAHGGGNASLLRTSEAHSKGFDKFSECGLSFWQVSRTNSPDCARRNPMDRKTLKAQPNTSDRPGFSPPPPPPFAPPPGDSQK